MEYLGTRFFSWIQDIPNAQLSLIEALHSAHCAGKTVDDYNLVSTPGPIANLPVVFGHRQRHDILFVLQRRIFYIHCSICIYARIRSSVSQDNGTN